MNKYRHEIKWGLIFIVMMLLWMVLERLLGWHDEHIDKHATYTNFVAIPAILVFVLAMFEKRKELGGYMTFKQGFISGLIITAVVTLFTPLVQWITSTVITPEYFTNAINHAVESGLKSQEEAEGYFNLQNYLIQSTIGSPIMGLITSAITALIAMRRNKSA